MDRLKVDLVGAKLSGIDKVVHAVRCYKEIVFNSEHRLPTSS